jgi:hypothetical protein
VRADADCRSHKVNTAAGSTPVTVSINPSMLTFTKVGKSYTL